MNQDQNNRKNRPQGGLPPEYEQACSEQYAPGNAPGYGAQQPRTTGQYTGEDGYAGQTGYAPRNAYVPDGYHSVPRAQGGPDETAVPSGADPSLDYD